MSFLNTRARFNANNATSFRFAGSRAAWMSTVMVLSVGALTACGDSTAPADKTYDNPSGTYMAAALAIMGSGEGGVSVTPKAVPEGYFVADIKVRLRKAMPNATYIIQRAPEIGRASASNGICERALGLGPWSSADPAAPAFITFVPSGATAPVTLTTTAAGEGATDFEFRAPAIPAGTKFDVMFRLINDPVAPTAVILSQCFTVTVL